MSLRPTTAMNVVVRLLLTVVCGIGVLATAHAQATIPAAINDRE